MLVNNSGKPNEKETEPFPNALWYHEALGQYIGQTFDQPLTLKPTDIINIQFTSGTTSAPKAACLTHINILNNAYFVGQNLGLTEEDKICCAPPLFHCFGIVLGVLAALTHGCTIILPSESFSPKAVLEALASYDATALYGVPTMFLAALDEVSKSGVSRRTFSKLRTGLIGGSIISPSLRQKIHLDLNLPSLLNIYGMTESSPVCCMTRLTDDNGTHSYTVGSVMPHTELRVVSHEDPSQIIPKGARGELLISGYLVMKGYWEDEQKTSEAFVIESTPKLNGSNGPKIWLRTGDEALMQVDGTIKITGRIKDTIIRAGENIYPSEIENALLQRHSMGSIAVVGLSDEYYGEAVAAFIVPHLQSTILETDDDLTFDFRESSGRLDRQNQDTLPPRYITSKLVREWVRESLSKNCIPKYIFWLSQLPLTASGKIEKYKLREMGDRWLAFKKNSPPSTPTNSGGGHMISGLLPA
ncbi:hypothetical protein TWF694_005423 [Orbilia ellipsospora]|uniref:Acetyl-CoA synthetase-like protein n=1 Tax=Orbilia ellipsospora TaxID=2528407 RepID=A0AAV9WT22_9PEZI